MQSSQFLGFQRNFKNALERLFSAASPILQNSSFAFLWAKSENISWRNLTLLVVLILDLRKVCVAKALIIKPQRLHKSRTPNSWKMLKSQNLYFSSFFFSKVSFSLEIPKCSQDRNNPNRNMLLKFLGFCLPSWQAAQLPTFRVTYNPGSNPSEEPGNEKITGNYFTWIRWQASVHGSLWGAASKAAHLVSCRVHHRICYLIIWKNIDWAVKLAEILPSKMWAVEVNYICTNINSLSIVVALVLKYWYAEKLPSQWPHNCCNVLHLPEIYLLFIHRCAQILNIPWSFLHLPPSQMNFYRWNHSEFIASGEPVHWNSLLF